MLCANRSACQTYLLLPRYRPERACRGLTREGLRTWTILQRYEMPNLLTKILAVSRQAEKLVGFGIGIMGEAQQ